MNLSPEKLAPPVAFVLIGSILLIIGVTGIIPVGNPQPTIAEPLPKAAMILIGVLLILSGPILVWREQKSSTDSTGEMLGPSPKKFRLGKQDKDSAKVTLANRRNLYPLEVLIQKAREEIILYAIHHSHIVHEGQGILKAKLETGCRIKILLMAGKNQNGEDNPNAIEAASHRTYKDLLHEIEASTRTFEIWFDSLTEATKN